MRARARRVARLQLPLPTHRQIHPPPHRDDKTRVEILRANVARRDAGSRVPAAQLLEILRTAGGPEARKTILALFSRFLGDDVGNYRAIVDLFADGNDVRLCRLAVVVGGVSWWLGVCWLHGHILAPTATATDKFPSLYITQPKTTTTNNHDHTARAGGQHADRRAARRGGRGRVAPGGSAVPQHRPAADGGGAGGGAVRACVRVLPLICRECSRAAIDGLTD